MVIKEELFTCIHVCLHVIQHRWIKRINNNFPCIPFLQNSRHSSFSMKLKRRQKILCLILIISTNIVNMLKIRALPVFGWFNECIIYIFSYSSDSGTAPRDSTEEVCAATAMALEGTCIYRMPMGNLWISTNFGIGKCEGMGGEINLD